MRSTGSLVTGQGWSLTGQFPAYDLDRVAMMMTQPANRMSSIFRAESKLIFLQLVDAGLDRTFLIKLSHG